MFGGLPWTKRKGKRQRKIGVGWSMRNMFHGWTEGFGGLTWREGSKGSHRMLHNNGDVWVEPFQGILVARRLKTRQNFGGDDIDDSMYEGSWISFVTNSIPTTKRQSALLRNKRLTISSQRNRIVTDAVGLKSKSSKPSPFT